MPMPNLCSDCKTRTADPFNTRGLCARCVSIVDERDAAINAAEPVGLLDLVWIGCDRCPARAVACYMSAGSFGVLTFCGHHAKDFHEALEAQQFYLI